VRVTVEGTVYEWGSRRLLNTEAILIKRKLGMNVNDWYAAIKDSDPEAVTCMVWLARRRAGEPELRYDDVEFDLGDIQIDNTEEDLADAPDPTVTATAPASPTAATALAVPALAAPAPARNAAATGKPSVSSGK
jgi:hypothetical protein